VKRRDLFKAASPAAFSPGIPMAGAADIGAAPGQVPDRTQWSTIETVQDHLLPSERALRGACEHPLMTASVPE